ncbi:MAG: PTS sugar transporter subunit IIB [Clostridiales bacterium]|nr:PTS sugar transporter subunit IIB [Clostridiales bacterium]MCD8223312.1 PTS sugar transporter subunit IIB [Clostridiales bacterium]
MSVELARVDERLVHGQIMTAWVRRFWIQRIVLVDDEIARDEFMKQLLAMSAPAGVTVEARSVADTAEILKTESGEKTMLLFKEIGGALALVEQGYDLKELNIGNIGSTPARKAITREVYVSQEEKEMLRRLQAAGVESYIQKLPQDSRVDIMSKI